MSRGRDAANPTEFPRAGWMDIGSRIVKSFGSDRISLISAGVAFFGLLALFPAFTALLAVGGLVLDTSVIVEQLDASEGVVPPDVVEILRNQAQSVTLAGGLELTLLLSVLLAIWSASRGVATLCDGLNVVYKEEEKRSFFLRSAVSVGLTLIIMVGVLAAVLAIVALPVLLSFAALTPIAEVATQLLTWVLLAALIIASISLIYRLGPARSNARWSWISPGAIVAWLLWLIASIGFTIYVQNFASYNESFGAIGGVIVLMMWLWISAMAILIGGKVNAEMEHQTREDTTTGPEKPMGSRGAVVADELGPARDA
ncbi:MULTISPECIES: YihY/virulence factor BrkB family protein [Halocynthiibacter]|uniref:YihY/virulence factor BrkB family protein n=1 Tax=Halocynthiibacter halioticoli TaxID=2986804 RepID=A0AAE3LUM6_9RHOB|nr:MULTISPECIES: YihY/virulence factor BrkB family protein [Halocynthiibacter]MCV6824850.1 YihY/virulence factor BrkB family protein [Halocynthiibacter halioticoli]MCW4057851.1 YihY/virulence factor BrkB family protein [Halocynthiibacter sp. SDUM655004]MDE0589125.1 YihY/virulence factor BrkB family protein [Halocynthiibacter sp. C4]